MSTPKTPGQEIFTWLRANGWNLGGLTGQDVPALRAAAEILACYSRCDGDVEAGLLSAFRGVVLAIQPSQRHLAYHAIAHGLDWHNRADFWAACGLEALPNPGRCTNE